MVEPSVHRTTGPEEPESPPPEPTRRGRRGHSSSALWSLFLAPGAIWLAVFFLIPLGLVAAMSVGTVDVVGRPIYSWHPGNYHQVFDPVFLPVLGRSVLYAVIATVICLVLGYAVAYTIAMFGGRYRNAFILLVIAPWFVDYLVRLYAWVEILNDQGIANSILQRMGLVGSQGYQLMGTTPAVLVGLVYDYLPLMILPIYFALEQMDRHLIEAGKDLNASPRQTFLHVTFPVTIPGSAVGMLLVFLAVVGDFATAQLLGGPENYMIGNLIQDEFAGSASIPVGAGLTVVLLVMMLIVLAVGAFWLRRREPQVAA